MVSPSIVPLGNFAELIRTVTYMVLKDNDRCTSSPLPRYDYVRQVGIPGNVTPDTENGSCERRQKIRSLRERSSRPNPEETNSSISHCSFSRSSWQHLGGKQMRKEEAIRASLLAYSLFAEGKGKNTNVNGGRARMPIFLPNDLFLHCQVIYSQFGLAIHQNDHQARRRFIEWAQNEIAVVPDFHKRILFSDEAHFWLNGYVNKQNCRIWSEANPQVYVETPLHPEKLTIWCALWAGGILLQKR
ncbi:hypothetical protein TNCV_3909821 [Trichonephila clavipes]|nr:hypothetical protein TNCV_3909821 [Trichonephila clavipes]